MSRWSRGDVALLRTYQIDISMFWLAKLFNSILFPQVSLVGCLLHGIPCINKIPKPSQISLYLSCSLFLNLKMTHHLFSCFWVSIIQYPFLSKYINTTGFMFNYAWSPFLLSFQGALVWCCFFFSFSPHIYYIPLSNSSMHPSLWLLTFFLKLTIRHTRHFGLFE